MIIEPLETRDLLAVSSISFSNTLTPTAGVPLPNDQVVATFAQGDTGNNSTPQSYYAVINWGDGTSSVGSIAADPSSSTGYEISATHTYAQATRALNPDIISATVYDYYDNTSLAASTNVTVADQAPVAAGTQPTITATQGVALTNTPVATFTDANPLISANYFSASISWGDGSFSPGTIVQDGIGSDATYYVEGSHTYSTYALSGYGLSITVTDPSSSLTINTNTANIIPGALLISPTPLTVSDGSVNLSNQTYIPAGTYLGSFTDASGAQSAANYQTISSFASFPGATANTPIVVNPTTPNGNNFLVETGADAYFTNPFQPGVETYTLQIGDNNGRVAYAPGSLTITGATLTASPAPTVTARTSGTASTPTVAEFSVANSQATTGQFTASIDWGDNSQDSIGTLTVLSSSTGIDKVFTIAGTHTYATPNAVGYPVTITLQELGNPTPLVLTNSIVVNDAALTPANPQPTVSAVAGQPFSNVPVASFTYGNAQANASNFTASISWGAHASVATTPGTIVLVGGNSSGNTFDVLGSNSYTNYGSSTITVSITDLASTNIEPTTTATVTDAVITAQATAISAVQGTAFSGTVGTFIDANALEPLNQLTATINWGDGSTPSSAAITQPGGVGTPFVVGGTHTYTSPGNFTTAISVMSAGESTAFATGSAAVAAAALSDEAGAQPGVVTVEQQSFTTPVATFSVASSNVTPNSFLATINWGDGQTPSIGLVTETGSVPGVSASFQVSGTHTYLDAGVSSGTGTYPISVNVVNLSGGSLAIANTASVAIVPEFVNGQLNPASDSGVSNMDAITKVTQPNFFGNTQPYSTVSLYVQPTTGGPLTLMGQAQASGAGTWSITSNYLYDGSYNVFATAVDQFGESTATQQLLPNVYQGPLVIDTAAPRVTKLTYDPLTSVMYVTYQDPESLLNQQSLTSGANYRVVNSGIKIGSVLVTKLNVTAESGPGGQQTVAVVLDHGKKIHGGPLYVTILSGGIEDIAGNALSGSFFGNFPSGNSLPGSNFQAFIALFTGRITTFPYYSTVHAKNNSKPSVAHAMARPLPVSPTPALVSHRTRMTVAQTQPKVQHAVHSAVPHNVVPGVEFALIKQVGRKP